MTERTVDRGPEARAAAQLRQDELERFPKADLAMMHAQAMADLVGPAARQDYLDWHKDLLVRAVLEDEGHLYHPQTGGPDAD